MIQDPIKKSHFKMALFYMGVHFLNTYTLATSAVGVGSFPSRISFIFLLYFSAQCPIALN